MQPLPNMKGRLRNSRAKLSRRLLLLEEETSELAVDEMLKSTTRIGDRVRRINYQRPERSLQLSRASRTKQLKKLLESNS